MIRYREGEASDLSDLTWPSLTNITWHIGIAYTERRVRDWRFLWLRHRIVGEIVGVVDPEVKT